MCWPYLFWQKIHYSKIISASYFGILTCVGHSAEIWDTRHVSNRNRTCHFHMIFAVDLALYKYISLSNKKFNPLNSETLKHLVYNYDKMRLFRNFQSAIVLLEYEQILLFDGLFTFSSTIYKWLSINNTMHQWSEKHYQNI